MKHLTLILCSISIFLAHEVDFNLGAIRDDVPDHEYLSLALENKFKPVGLILKNDQPNASAVLIHDSWILTAGHEVIGLEPNDIKFQLGVIDFEIISFNIFPGYKQKGVLGHNGDLALLRLNKPVRDVAPANIYKGRDELGKVGITVGFGRSGSGASIITNPTPVGKKRAGQNVIDSIGGVIDGRTILGNLLVSDFDHHTIKKLNKIGSATPTELEYCPVGGDSGGGLFIVEENQWYLAGLVSAFTPKINDDLELGLHGSLVYWTRLSDFSDWVAKTISS